MQTAETLKIGLLNDIHYDGRAPAMNRLYEAIASLNRGGAGTMVVMGDLIDGESEPHALRLLREVAALCDSFKGSVHYMPGNHDLDYLSKAQFYNALGRAGDTANFIFSKDAVEFICIDGNYSVEGTPYEQGNFTWEDTAVPDGQLLWLRDCLDAASTPIVVLSHQRVDVSSPFAIKNGEAVRRLLAASGKVKAVFQGHQHADDLQNVDGIPYYTLSAHKDDAGPAVVQIDAGKVRLIRDFKMQEPT